MTEQLDGLRIAIAPQLKFSRIAFPLLWLASMCLATSDPKTYERQYDFIIIAMFTSVFGAATLHMIYSTLWQLFGREELYLTPTGLSHRYYLGITLHRKDYARDRISNLRYTSSYSGRPDDSGITFDYQALTHRICYQISEAEAGPILQAFTLQNLPEVGYTSLKTIALG